MLGEIFLALWVYQQTEPIATRGYLIKNGLEYLLIWNVSDGTERVVRGPELAPLVRLAADKLKLVMSANPNPRDTLESVWLRQDIGRYKLFWKTLQLPYLNRLTFRGIDEAKAFEAAFRRGSYSPSPYGHSILLTSTLSDPRLN